MARDARLLQVKKTKIKYLLRESEVRFFPPEASLLCMAVNDNIERLFKQHYSGMIALASAMLKDPEAAHDAVSDVFALLIQNGLGPDKGAGYFIRTLRNHCVSILREMSVKERAARLIRTDFSTEDEDQAREREERLVEISHIIREKLPSQCSRIMLMRFEEGLSYREIARRMGMSEVAVYKHLRNGVAYIKKNLTD